MDILKALEGNETAYLIGLVLLLISMTIKTIRGVIDFHEEISVTRRFKKLDSFAEHAEKDSATFQYIKKIKENEIFRMESGINTYPEKATMLMEMYLLGIASKSDLKRLSLYLEPKNNKVSISVTWLDKSVFMYSCISSLVLFLLGFHVALSNIITCNYIKIIIGLIIASAYIFASAFTGRDYKTLSILRRVKNQLVVRNMVTNPDDSIEWNPTLWSFRSIAVTCLTGIKNLHLVKKFHSAYNRFKIKML